MTYGANLFSDTGKLFYSTNYATLQFIGKFAASAATILSQNVMQVTFACVGVPLVFIEGDGRFQQIDALVYNGSNNWTATASSGTLAAGLTSTGTFYVFGKPAASVSGWGMQAFDASGNCVLNTSQRMLKIAAVGVTSANSGAFLYPDDSDNFITTVESGSIPASFAIAAVGLGLMWRPGGPISLLYSMGARRYSSTQVSFSRCRPFAQQPGAVTTYYLAGNQKMYFIDTSLYQ